MRQSFIDVLRSSADEQRALFSAAEAWVFEEAD